MFTGIITDVGHIKSIEQKGDTVLTIETSYDMSSVDIGASIASSGICLTVIDKGEGWYKVEASAETRACTNLSDWHEGTLVNLERALKVGDELGGHIVTGHVDAVGEIVKIDHEGDSKIFNFEMPESVAKFVAMKGSITINGVSLTVNKVYKDADKHIFNVNIIPHTQQHTNFHAAKVGDKVNLEIDILARYVARMNES